MEQVQEQVDELKGIMVKNIGINLIMRKCQKQLHLFFVTK